MIAIHVGFIPYETPSLDDMHLFMDSIVSLTQFAQYGNYTREKNYIKGRLQAIIETLHANTLKDTTKK